jgi:alpha-1,3-rhamnosyltransferase
MDETPLVSVITPCYNHGKYIRDTIESVVKQTYKNIEYFVIDDGSTDNSAEVIEKLKEKYHFIFEHQENKGLAFTMNKLIAKCKGKYVALVESDDVWTLDKIEKQVAFLEANPDVAVCGGNALCINEQNEVLPTSEQYILKHTVYDLKNIMSLYFQIWPLTIIMRREIYDLIGKFDETLLFIDVYAWLKITINNYSIVILPYHFGYYRVHESNVHYNSFKMYQTLVKIIDKFKDHPLYSTGRRNVMWFSLPYLAMNDKKEAIKILPKAFRFDRRTVNALIVLLIPFPIFKHFYKTRYR